MKTLLIMLLIPVSFLFVQCKSRTSQAPQEVLAMEQMDGDFSAKQLPLPPTDVDRANSAAPVSEPSAGMDPLPGKISKKLIKDGSLQIAVKNLKKSKTEVDSLVAKYKGYYSNESYNNTDNSDEYVLSIRIPSAHFEAFVKQVEAGAGDVIYKNIASRDVTEEYIDLETRLKNKEDHLQQFGELLKRARSIEDIVEIQDITRKIEEELESVQGRLKYLNNQIDYSTLYLTISKSNYNKYSQSHGNFFDQIKLALVKGWFGLVSFAIFIIKIWPFWIISGIIFYLYKKWIAKRKKK
jgi:hypothetical protein